jgi:hypothetical protein
MKIIIPNLFDGRERRGCCGEAAARQAGRGKEGTEDRENTDRVKNVLCGSQDLVETPLSTNAPGRTPNTPQPQPPHVALNSSCLQKPHLSTKADFLFARRFLTIRGGFSYKGNCARNYCAVATYVKQVLHHVITGSSQPSLFESFHK